MNTASLIIFAGRTASHRLLHSAARLVILSKADANQCLAHAGGALGRLELNAADYGQPPYEVLVPDRRRRCDSRFVRHRVCSSELPSGSLARIGRVELICSPAFTFYQMSRTLSLARACELGTNLCSSYWINWCGEICQRNQPIVTAASIRRFVTKNSSLYGCCRACDAARWIKDGSASPMETKLMLLLSLPARLGGFGLKDPVFNYRVNPGSSHARTEQQFFKVDIAFPEKRVGVEFNGEAFHRDRAKDWARINALESLGWRIVVIDKSLLFNAERLEKSARQIAALLGTRVQNRRNWKAKAAGLRRELGLLR